MVRARVFFSPICASGNGISRDGNASVKAAAAISPTPLMIRKPLRSSPPLHGPCRTAIGLAGGCGGIIGVVGSRGHRTLRGGPSQSPTWLTLQTGNRRRIGKPSSRRIALKRKAFA
jgi:hypothetical protein